MAYTFQTNLLSAQKTGSPNLLNTSLSGVAVTFLSGSGVTFQSQQLVVATLSTNDVGIAFNPVQVTIASNLLSTFALSNYPIVDVNVLGSTFRIPAVLNSSNFGIVKTTTGEFSVFPWLSGTTTVLLSNVASTRDVDTPNTRRLWLYGYV